MRIRSAAACAGVALLVFGWNSLAGMPSGMAQGSPRGAAGTFLSSTAHAKTRADGLTVALTASPSPATTSAAVGFRLQADVQRARGALAYVLSYGDGTSSSNITPDVCQSGVGSPVKMTWWLRHRYDEPGTYHVVATVRPLCTSGRAAAHMTIDVT